MRSLIGQTFRTFRQRARESLRSGCPWSCPEGLIIERRTLLVGLFMSVKTNYKAINTLR